VRVKGNTVKHLHLHENEAFDRTLIIYGITFIGSQTVKLAMWAKSLL